MSETVTEEAVTASVTDTGRAPRPDKVAIVDEIASKLGTAEAVFVSEYRGLTVAHLARLRAALRPSDAEHKVYKNTLARLAVSTAGVEGLEELLIGPSAITFVKGDIAGAAKALRDTSRTNPLLAEGRSSAPLRSDDPGPSPTCPRAAAVGTNRRAFRRRWSDPLSSVPRTSRTASAALIEHGNRRTRTTARSGRRPHSTQTRRHTFDTGEDWHTNQKTYSTPSHMTVLE